MVDFPELEERAEMGLPEFDQILTPDQILMVGWLVAGVGAALVAVVLVSIPWLCWQERKPARQSLRGLLHH